MEKIVPPSIYLADTQTEKGRGIFASRFIKSGTLVEAAPVIVLYRSFEKIPPRLRTYVFNWGSLAGLQQPAFSVALGYGVYNHDNPANMRYEADKDMSYYAVRDIEENEELTINYNPGGGSEVSDNDLWFEVNKVKPL